MMIKSIESNFPMHEEKYHQQLFKELHEQEVNLLKFVAVVIPAAGVFMWSLLKYYQHKHIAILIEGYFATLVLCGWGMLFAMKLAYRHRYLQIIMFKIEEKLQLPHFNQWKKNWKYWRKILRDKKLTLRKYVDNLLPETYQLHFYMFGWIIFLTTIFTIVLIFISELCIQLKLLLTTLLIAGICICYYFVYKGLKNYINKLSKLKLTS